MFRAFPNFHTFKPLTFPIEGMKDSMKPFWDDLKKVVAGVPSIEIIYGQDQIRLKSVSLNYSLRNDEYFRLIDNWSKQYPDHFRKKGRFLSLLNAVNNGDKTILIKIHLNRKKENILKDVNSLINFIAKEAKYRNFNLKRPKPHWDEYEKYLSVYDLKKENPRLTWSDIAKKIFPDEVYENKKLSKQIALPSARDKVRYYWNRANIMINKGGWKEI